MVLISGCVTGPSTPSTTETNTETSTGTPAPEPKQDEDGNTVCEWDVDEDSGCSEGIEVKTGADPGFSLPENLRLNVSLVYAGPVASKVEPPWDNDVITYVSALTSSQNPGKDVTFTIRFVNESALGRYIHMEKFIDFFNGKTYVYPPTVIRIDEGYEWGRRWEIHLYSGITGDSGYFMLYNLTEEGLKEVQRGNDDPMGGFGVTILLDDDYLDWDYNYGVPHKSWSGTFRVNGVTGGKSEVTIAFSVG
ncbi:hypothetical protein [Thermococcus sp.]|uniref:hypothetical protein n=1 Tax=Thermococcus sp. TaxID=35749 RepID=UPI0026188951|nr:hypothetical protein [Thermococcus sp.]